MTEQLTDIAGTIAIMIFMILATLGTLILIVGAAISLKDWFAERAAEKETTERKLVEIKQPRRITMGNEQFEKLVKRLVANYANKHLDKTDSKEITENDVFIVWICKTLQNNKALASTTLFDGMYYELTYNGDKDELYFDAYKKWENICYSAPPTDL